jgi:hypothetical protein
VVPTSTVPPTATPTPTGARFPVSGIVFVPGPGGLRAVPNATVNAFICNRLLLCLGEQAIPVATAVTSLTGMFTLSIPADPFTTNRLLFEALVDGVRLRSVFVTGRLPGLVPYGANGADMAVVDPISEAAVRLFAEAGLESFDDDGVLAVNDAVRDANSETVFNGLSIEAAAALATDTAANDPTVQEVLSERATPTPTVVAPCPGDCNGDGVVTVNELIRGVNIPLGNLPLDSCPAFDRNGNGSIEINELIAAVNALLSGCL